MLTGEDSPKKGLESGTQSKRIPIYQEPGALQHSHGARCRGECAPVSPPALELCVPHAARYPENTRPQGDGGKQTHTHPCDLGSVL